ncbi:hypothetical protein [Leeuwenhoekiella nanhaiensis]|uniref:Uncharacterized protein n=1 Tax=Leeuwenhoekiella nanhaiensis TaxID=1655491 RepID=A0A2G1VM55_9FLAO|nr:hypothetical protein [Leeuwenhoekiella nanhaiensis]PHQ27857.1 hypothetical protein CJ305_17790 [Leeuwenhoekiella nanhaiensis]
MTSQSAILEREFESIKQDLIAKHIELGMPASGNWERSLVVDVQRLKATITGAPYTEQLVNGREPGKFPPIAAIRQWILDKPIPFLGKIKLSSLAFLIARKIAKEGTNYFKQGGTDLVEAVITPERIQSIIDKVSEFYIDSFTTQITGFLKKMAA